MESIMRRFLPKPGIRLTLSQITEVVDNNSILHRYVSFFGKRVLVFLTCFNLLTYRIIMCCIGYLFGKWLVQWQIIPYRIHRPRGYKEDPGVIEMRAMLRGEDCFNFNLNQSQRRSSLPADFSPYEEICLGSYHSRMIMSIAYLVKSLKTHDEPLAPTFNSLFAWFDDRLINHLKSQVIVNKRD
ncbi:uncharacterized protein TNIN_480321 [Trichonephila inaurata madagascariensis]|uniref:Uncharacterized protein n=1 Tax=Trichonephila inaurata madagascariensis TaxID=2747483 RepID=A0A8X6XWV0_9ARAC|nr:uncharacterized protein TNIN_364561 [Trichonephila inaurata madagascariensis]GFY60164.1 uncharacterized protein TNIN_480321 [Trichonephila inaurata madagascariensis]